MASLEDFSDIEQLVQGEDIDVLLEGFSTLALHLAVGKIRLLSLKIAQSVATAEQIASVQSSVHTDCLPFTLSQSKQFALLQIKANLFLDHYGKKRLPLLNLVPRLLLAVPRVSNKPVEVVEGAAEAKKEIEMLPHELAALQLTQQLQREEKAAEARRMKNKQKKKRKDKQGRSTCEVVLIVEQEEGNEPNAAHCELLQDKGEERIKEAAALPLVSPSVQDPVLAASPLASPPLELVETHASSSSSSSSSSSFSSSSTSEQAVILALREELRDVKQKHEEIVRALHLRLYIAQNALEEEVEKNRTRKGTA